MGTATSTHTIQQQRIAEILSRQFGFPKEDVYFLNSKKPDEPWLPSSALMAIARRSPDVQLVSERFYQHIEPLNQVVYVATVTLKDDRVFERSGVAALDEKLPESEDEADPHRLAAARAIRNALASAGIDPMRDQARTPVATFADTDTRLDDAEMRASDLARIHLLAMQKGLIKFVAGGKDPSKYKEWLCSQTQQLHREVNSAGELNQQERACIISALEQLPDAELV